MNNSEEDKIWKENEETRRKESVGNQLPTTQEDEEAEEEEIANGSATSISRDFGNGGDQSTLPEQQENNTDEKVLRNA